ncbi:hypothetical protein UlMin_026715 [Ulmus minor]
MFPLHQSNKLSFHISFGPHQQCQASEDLILSHAQPDDGARKRRRRKSVEKSTDSEKKKTHREIERQRRQEMSTLFVSLRSLLPLEFIKGKRSMPDHMKEAVSYVNHLKKKIKELEVKRNELKQLACENGKFDSFSPSYFTINPSNGGMEIIISSSYSEGGLPLSRVLKFLFEEGLGVLTCISSKVNNRFVHTIQSEVCDNSLRDQTELQRKLKEFNPSLRYYSG